jgi:hypothetical protein
MLAGQEKEMLAKLRRPRQQLVERGDPARALP